MKSYVKGFLSLIILAVITIIFEGCGGSTVTIFNATTKPIYVQEQAGSFGTVNKYEVLPAQSFVKEMPLAGINVQRQFYVTLLVYMQGADGKIKSAQRTYYPQYYMRSDDVWVIREYDLY